MRKSGLDCAHVGAQLLGCTSRRQSAAGADEGQKRWEKHEAMQQTVPNEAKKHLEQYLEAARARKCKDHHCQQCGEASVEHAGAHVHKRLLRPLNACACCMNKSLCNMGTAKTNVKYMGARLLCDTS